MEKESVKRLSKKYNRNYKLVKLLFTICKDCGIKNKRKRISVFLEGVSESVSKIVNK